MKISQAIFKHPLLQANLIVSEIETHLDKHGRILKFVVKSGAVVIKSIALEKLQQMIGPRYQTFSYDPAVMENEKLLYTGTMGFEIELETTEGQKPTKASHLSITIYPK